MTETHDSARAAVAAALPAAIARALDGYTAFADSPPATDSREFAQFHSGCKAALAHLDALLKLAQATRPVPADADPAEDAGDAGAGSAELGALLREARAAVAQLRSRG